MRVTSLKGRILILILLAVGATQAVVVGFQLWGEAQRYAVSRRDLLLAEARVLAAAVSEPTARRDRRGVLEALRAAGRLADVRFVSVEDAAGRRIADLGAAEFLTSDLVIDSNAPISPLAMLRARSFVSKARIVQGGVEVGTVSLIGDAGDLKQSLASGLTLALGLAAAALGLALVTALRMQTAITAPLTGLMRAMSRVAESHDYSTSLPDSGVAEIAALTVGFNRMLGEIRDRDARISESYSQLEQQVLDRTADLRDAKNAAEAAKALAEGANAQKSSFLATMSHEIRTPMNGMLVMAELLTRSPLPPAGARYADVIWRSGKSLLAIINDILDFSKIESGKLELERAPVDLVEIATTVLDLFAEKARTKGLDLAGFVSPNTPRLIYGDSVRLTQVLSNLVNNALKFTETGGVMLRIVNSVGRPDVLVFQVQDTGVGIPADKVETIFGAFSQADMSTTRKYGGTGLGLAICRRLVEAMGARIEVQSEVAAGSTFSFALQIERAPNQEPDWPWLPASTRLPALVCVEGRFTREAIVGYLQCAGAPHEFVSPAQLSNSVAGQLLITDAQDADLQRAADNGSRLFVLRPPGEAASRRAETTFSQPLARDEVAEALAALAQGRAPAPRARTPTLAPERRFTGLRALVADDNEVNREVASEALRQLGVETTLVCDGAEAVEAWSAGGYDLAFLDGSMPVLDGFEAAREIRAREAKGDLPRTPLVALTAHVLGSDADAWSEAGMDALLVKPFTLEQLRRAIESVQPHSSVAIEPEAEPALAPLQELLDPNTLGELARLSAGSHSDLLGRIVRLYLEHAPAALERLKAAVDDRDGEAAAKTAHALKSMSLNIGARAVASQAASIEDLSRRESPLPEAQVVALARLVEATCAELKRELLKSQNGRPEGRASETPQPQASATPKR